MHQLTLSSLPRSAAIPSGVGFLGAGLIWKGSLSDGNGGEVHQVHGITTAASVWLAAAVGVGAGGALYAVTAYSTALITIVLRFGPRLYFQNDKGFEDDDDLESEDREECSVNGQTSGHVRYTEKSIHQQELTNLGLRNIELNDVRRCYGSTDTEKGIEYETQALLSRENQGSLDYTIDGTKATRSICDQCKDNRFLSLLMKLVPSKERSRPPNPFQEHSNDKDIKRLIMKRKSMKKTKSGVSFCT
jgi:uncharacterized membrane protein YhiD involved in acid resistance